MDETVEENNSFNESSIYLSPLSPSESASELYSTASGCSFAQEMRTDSADTDDLEDKNLPETVTILTCQNGAMVYVIGTAHFSIESQNDVSKVMKAVKPHAVVVELCKARAGVMEMDEETILNEAKSVSLRKITRVMREAGPMQAIFYVLLLKLSASVTKTFGIAPGGEFRRALQEMKKLDHCALYFADRPFNITIKRAFARLTLFRAIVLFVQLLFAKTDDLSLQDIENCKKKDLLNEIMEKCLINYPDLSEVFVNERDIFLTKSIELVASNKQYKDDPDGDVVPGRIVAIVGIGHCQGISKHWGKVTNEQIISLLLVPKPTLSVRIACFTVRTGITCLFIYGCYRILPITRLTTLAKLSILSLVSKVKSSIPR